MRALPGLVLFLGLIAGAGSIEASRRKPPPCTGRFVLEGGKIALFSSQAVVSEITLDGGGMMLTASCGFVHGQRRATKAGWKLKARWKHCVLGNDVRMTARVPSACDRMTGSLVVDLGRLVSRRFTARSCGPLAQDGRGTWDVIREQVIAGRGCTTDACHGSALSGGLDLRGDPYDRLIDVPSSSGTLRRIEPGDQLRSLLWRKVAKATRGTTDDVGPGMPVGLPPLSEDELEALKAWIRNGAPHTGVVPGTAERLGTCLAKADPPTIRPAAPPAPGTGVQLYAPPWRVPANGENEVCYATWYDVRAQVPPALLHPCPSPWGPEKTCFDYRAEELTQSPNSHHSIIHSYVGPSDVTAPGFGPFACRGGSMDGRACNPKGIGVAAPAGADCGPGGGCAGEPQSTVACIGFGPAELAFRAFGLPQIGGSQQPLFRIDYPYGVVATLPVEGIIVWNSHAFNVTDVETTNEEWFNLYFPDPAPEARQYPVQGIFDMTDIFVMQVPPFESREYCRTFTLPRGARLFQLTSHTHKRGVLFRTWGPGIATPCSSACSSVPCVACLPEAGPPLLRTTEYNNPDEVHFDPPMALDGADPASRTFKFCAVYDNGKTDPLTVRRASSIGGSCGQAVCFNEAKRGRPCGNDHRACDSRPGANDGICDACTLVGGVTTEDEMFIQLGRWYLQPPAP